MQKIEIIILSVSLAVTALVSTLFGFFGTMLVGTFWAWFGISFLAQVIIFLTINSVLIRNEYYSLRQTEIEELEALSKFTITLACGYCKQPNTIGIQLNQRNTFKCESCNQTNSITMQFSAVPVTTPIESVKIPVENSSSIEFKVSA